MKFFSSLSIAAITLLISVPSFADNNYPPKVKSIVEQRCMVCHGCYDAPCQLKLDAWEGLQRGASKEIVYDGTRLEALPPTRLFEDANTVEQWRKKGFFPVLNKQATEQSTIARMLTLKQEHPLPPSGKLPDTYTLGLDREQQCAKEEDFDKFARKYPQWGMPYALPGLSQADHQTLTDWIDEGAPGVARSPAPAAEVATIHSWEDFLNGESLKQRLMSRYLYEHLFVGNLYFSDLQGDSRYYNLVRSRTPAGKPIDIIPTRRPYDDPGQQAFYYRLQPLQTAVLAKRHMPYALNKARMNRWQSLFLDPEYEVSSFPSYANEVASNPFIAYRELPQKARYKFMLDEAQFTLMGFIKGPVCRGQVALNVIDDHFWVVFLDPDRQKSLENAEFLAENARHLRLPGDNKKGAIVTIIEWKKYAREQLNYLAAKFEYIHQATAGVDGTKVDLDLIWNGDGHNKNAALTIFRHKNSASVVKGFVGHQPKTAWVIDYSLLERIHYLLVAGFDVFGNVAHQLETRLYMDFLRMEGEQNFLFFLPKKDRIPLRNFWYRGASEDTKKFVITESEAYDRETAIQYHTDNPKQELLNMLQERQPGAAAKQYQPADAGFSGLSNLQSSAFSLLPEVAFVEVVSAEGESEFFTIVHNDSYTNNAQIFREAERRIPQEDYLTVVKGFLGTYPNIFFTLQKNEIEGFVAAIKLMRSEEDYSNLVTRYGVRRTNAESFWPMSDRLNTYYQKNYPLEAGIFDLNRYENR